MSPPTLPSALATELSGRTNVSEPGNSGRRAITFTPTLGAELTLTSNANFDSGGGGNGRADIVTQITPGFLVDARGAHTSLAGSVNLPIFMYARTGSENNRATPDVHLAGTLEALDRHFFVNAGIDAHREFASPFGARPSSGVVNSQNEYLATVYTISPSFRGELPGRVRYEVTDSNIWTNATSAPNSLENTYTNQLVAAVSTEPTPFGAGAEYNRTEVSYTADRSTIIDIARLRGDFAADQQLRLSASVGYEKDQFFFANYNNPIYGAGLRWRPSLRSSVDANWEHRFFGSSYFVALDHRTPLTTWSLRASRDLSTSPQQLAALGNAGSLAPFLDSLLSSRYPDPIQRQQAINQLIQSYGLPNSLDSAVNLFSQQVSIVTALRAVAGLIGARNNVYFSVFRQRDQALAALGQQPISFTDVTQTGADVVWASHLRPLLTMTATLAYSRARGDSGLQGSDQNTRNASASLNFSTPISPKTDVHAGTRYQVVQTSNSENQHEAAIYVGVFHRFE